MEDLKTGCAVAVGSGLGRDRLASLAAWLEQSAGRVLRQLDSGRELLCLSVRRCTTDLWAIREKSGFLRKHNPEPIQLTTGPSDMFGSVPSRDGKKLFAIQGAPLGELVRYDAKSQQFLPYLSGISAIHLSFSKDGQWVAYLSYPDGALWRSKVDGTERLQLTSPPMEVVQPKWSPDGKQIAFAASVPGKPKHIYIVSADGGAPKEVTNGERDGDLPNWSRDGNSLFFGNGSTDLRSSCERHLSAEFEDQPAHDLDRF